MPYDGLDEALALAARGTRQPGRHAGHARPGDRRARRSRSPPRWHGRLLVLDREAAAESTGHGSPLPHAQARRPGPRRRRRRAGRHARRQALPAARRGAGLADDAGGGDRRVRARRGAARRRRASVPQALRGPADRRLAADAPAHRRARPTSSPSAASRATTSTCTSTRSRPRRRRSASASRTATSCCRRRPGLFVSPAPGPVLANYGLDTLRFVKPVGIGDTIRARLTCKRKIDRNSKDAQGRRPGRGRVGRRGDEPGRRAGRELRHPDAGGEEVLRPAGRHRAGKTPSGALGARS